MFAGNLFCKQYAIKKSPGRFAVAISDWKCCVLLEIGRYREEKDTSPFRWHKSISEVPIVNFEKYILYLFAIPDLQLLVLLFLVTTGGHYEELMM